MPRGGGGGVGGSEGGRHGGGGEGGESSGGGDGGEEGGGGEGGGAAGGEGGGSRQADTGLEVRIRINVEYIAPILREAININIYCNT